MKTNSKKKKKSNKTQVFVVTAYCHLGDGIEPYTIVGVYSDMAKAFKKANKYAFGDKYKPLNWELVETDKNTLVSHNMRNETMYISGKKVQIP